LERTWFVPLPVCDHSQGVYFPPNTGGGVKLEINRTLQMFPLFPDSTPAQISPPPWKYSPPGNTHFRAAGDPGTGVTWSRAAALRDTRVWGSPAPGRGKILGFQGLFQQTNKQTNKFNKQTNKQTNKRSYRTSGYAFRPKTPFIQSTQSHFIVIDEP